LYIFFKPIIFKGTPEMYLGTNIAGDQRHPPQGVSGETQDLGLERIILDQGLLVSLGGIDPGGQEVKGNQRKGVRTIRKGPDRSLPPKIEPKIVQDQGLPTSIQERY
jgi:hypothetical protein